MLISLLRDLEKQAEYKIKKGKQEEILKNMLVTLNKEEADMAKNLTDKYGKGNLDLETGEFIPID